jgi:translation initiation factor 2 beta subunit (eIF-2beta)/eIF-5
VDERRDPAPGDGTTRPALAAEASRLSPVQQARRLYVAHATSCPRCSDIDRNRCGDGERLWRGWTAACEEAYRRLLDN